MIQADRLWLLIEAVDTRQGIDGLSLKIQQALGHSPCDGALYAFRNRTGTRIKRLAWDGTGVWLCTRRLHRGHFTWPQSDEAVCVLSKTQWQWLTSGIDWRRLSARASAQWQV